MIRLTSNNPYKKPERKHLSHTDEAIQTVFGVITAMAIVGAFLITWIILIAKS